MKFDQKKSWPSRKKHLFLPGCREDDVAICGGPFNFASEQVRKGLNWDSESNLHPYDDLNYCQSCRRVAMGMHGEKYTPLTEKYEHIKRAYERGKR